MKVRLYGINLDPGKNILFSEFMDNLIEKDTLSFDHLGYKRFLYLNKDSDRNQYYGLLITTKDQKQFMELLNSEGVFTVNARSVSDHSELAEFNFFLLDADTGRGLYQHYHHSCALNQFGWILKKFFDSYKSERIDDELKEVKSRRDQGKIRKKYSDKFTWSPFVEKKTFELLLKEFKRIKAFKYTVSSIASDQSRFAPLSKYAKQLTESISFENTAPINSLISGITKITEEPNIESAKVEGVSQDGETFSIYLENNLDTFGDWEFDELAKHMGSFNPSQTDQSWFVKELRKIFDSNKPLFRTPVKKD